MLALLASAPDLVRAPDYITMWRTIGAYGTDSEGRSAAELASPPFTDALASIAAQTATAAARWCSDHGLAGTNSARIEQEAQIVLDFLTPP